MKIQKYDIFHLMNWEFHSSEILKAVIEKSITFRSQKLKGKLVYQGSFQNILLRLVKFYMVLMWAFL